MGYMLDTNILSDLIKHPAGKVAQRLSAFDAGTAGTVCTTIIVAGELRYGACKKASAALSQRIEQLLKVMPVLALDAACADAYGRVRAALEKKGLPIGANDLWIAAHALATNMTLVTHNEQEFGRVDGLKIENWLGRSAHPK